MIYDWSSQLHTQLKQLWNRGLKKIQAWTGFEHMTSAIPVQCSTDWAIKPSGIRIHWVSLTWLLYNLQLDDVTGADFENSLYAFGQSRKRQCV